MPICAESAIKPKSVNLEVWNLLLWCLLVVHSKHVKAFFPCLCIPVFQGLYASKFR